MLETPKVYVLAYSTLSEFSIIDIYKSRASAMERREQILAANHDGGFQHPSWRYVIEEYDLLD